MTLAHRLLRGALVRYAVLSDIHGNLAAFRAVLAAIGSVDAVWCLGDVVGYGPNPNECVDLVRRQAAICLAGNHDLAAATNLNQDGFNPDATQAIAWTRQQLTSENLSFLAGLPSRRTEGQITLVHGSPRDPVWEYTWSPLVAQENFTYFDTATCLVGHTHRPVIFRKAGGPVRQLLPRDDRPLATEAGRFILNPGSVGQPRDGDPRAAYLLLDTTAHTVRLLRVPYNVEETQTRMAQARLPARLITRLDFGS
jgi:predicted phosphodiesterase